MADPENFGGGIIKILSTKPHKAQKFKGFFRPKSGGLQKKKVFTEIETDFSAEIGNSNVFSAQNQVVSKKKKERSLPKLRLIFRPKSLGLGWWGMHPPLCPPLPIGYCAYLEPQVPRL